MTGIASLAAAGASGLGNLLSGALDQLYRWNDNNWQSPLDATIQLKNLDKDISDYFLNKQIDYNKWALDYQTNLQNTAYQRAFNDMKAAGINPASLAGVNASAASSPNAIGVNSSYHSGSQSISPQKYGSDLIGATGLNSAVNAMIAKDHNAAKLLASELVDNARHAHRMEELRESYQWKDALQSSKHYHENDVNHNPKADYYDEMAMALRAKRLGIDS